MNCEKPILEHFCGTARHWTLSSQSPHATLTALSSTSKDAFPGYGEKDEASFVINSRDWNAVHYPRWGRGPEHNYPEMQVHLTSNMWIHFLSVAVRTDISEIEWQRWREQKALRGRLLHNSDALYISMSHAWGSPGAHINIVREELACRNCDFTTIYLMEFANKTLTS